MIQRIQSVWLALAACVLFSTLFIPYAQFLYEDQTTLFSMFGLEENPKEVSTWFPYLYVTAFIGALCIFSILQFKNRKLQMNIGKILYVLILVLTGFIFYDVYTLGPKLTDDEAWKMAAGFGMYMPIISLILVFLANTKIKKDDNLVKSVDRLR